ncbi:unnamed protein product [Psylliodes chrysocephalus]|nr:unnamed protein product [Psylliodes chrysocephala]
MSASDLDNCASFLESDKVKERGNSCIKLSTHLENKSIVKILSNNGVCKILIRSLQTCMKKDADKIIEDEKKKSGPPAKSMAPELLNQLLNIAIKEDIDIKIREILGYTLGCLNDFKMKKCYEVELLEILRKVILSHPKSRGKLKQEEWIDIFNLIKNLIEENNYQLVNSNTNQSVKKWGPISNCFMLLIKWGPVCGLSPKILRENFDFMTKFCQKVTQNSPRFMQEDTLEVAINFCEHTAKDNRVSCCKFGEDIIVSLTGLYEPNETPVRVMELLIEFFLLQTVIHHPNGVTEGESAAYANNWGTWKKVLKTMDGLLKREINLYFKRTRKNCSFFKNTSFTKLFIEVSRQLFCLNLDVVSEVEEYSQPSQKRTKRELVTIKNYIEYVKTTKNWLWVHLVNSIIKTYPNLIDIDDYIYLLQILSSIQIESNEHDVIEYLYICLSTMLNLEKTLDMSQNQNKIKELWKLIGDNTTKAFGLNQHKHVTERLLEQLISRGIVNFEDVLQTYQSGLISLSLQTIRTFNSGLRFMILNDLQKKECVMKCILPQNCIEYKYLCSKETAKFLVKLTFKLYKSEEIRDDIVKQSDKYDKLNRIYLKTLLAEEALTIKKTETTEEIFFKPDTDVDSCGLLLNVVEDFVNSGEETEELLLSKVTLLANICSWLSEYNVQREADLKQSQFIILLESIINKDIIKNFPLAKSENERDLRRLAECLDIINVLFSLNVSKWVMDKLKESIPLDFLRKLSTFLNALQEKGKKYLSFYNLKVPVTQALSNFACICGRALNKNQGYLLEILSKPSYNYNMDDDYILCTVFLKTLKLSEPSVLPDPILYNILSCIKSLAEQRYQDKAEDILDILSGMYPHIAASKNNENKSFSVCLLKPFYNGVQDSGPETSIRLLECFQVLCELDPKNSFSRWSDREVIKCVPEFLNSDYHEVRLKAIDVLVTYYKANSNCNIITDIHRQEEIFDKIYNMSLAVFEVSGEITQQRRTDEVMCRAASVLLTFVNIITSSDNWIKDSLYNLLKISCLRGIEQIDRALNIINKRKYGEEDFNILEKYVLYLVKKWLDEGHSFNDFPFKLFKCETKFDFYRTYFEDCAYFLIMREQDDFKKLCEKLELTEEQVIEKTSAKILTSAICSDIDNFNSDIINENKILSNYLQIVGTVRLREMLKDNLEQVVIGILEFLTDEKYIQSQLGESVIFINKYLEASQVRQCFQFIENMLYDGQPLELLLTDIHLPKLEKILFQLKQNFYKNIVVKDQLKYFHRYTFFINFISEYLNSNRFWRHFFIRDVVHTLLNVIEINENCTSVISAACTFLALFLEKILPNLSETFKHFLHDTVNYLKKFYFTRKTISSKCRDILKFLIITNKHTFEEEIKKLDTFPDVADFGDIIFVQKEVRYGSKEPKLEDEIVQFLNNQDMVTKEDSLINLRKLLASQKDTLLDMYDKLQEIRGFSEDSEKSVLHRLVCVLSQLSYSSNQKVSFEAARCLGELGPANLQTVVLQPEKILVHQKHSPIEIIIGSVISMLSKYIIDCDINVLKRARRLFYEILHLNEGKKIINAGGDFGFGPINKDYITPYYSSQRKVSTQNTILNTKLFVEKMKDSKLWCPDTDISHNRWITTLVSTILKTFNDASPLSNLIEVCEVKVEFSECLLPLIIDLIISKGVIGVTSLITKQMDYFFTQHWKMTKQDFREDCIVLNKKSVKSMLNIINYVRLQKKGNRVNSRLSVDELTVDYLKVAKAAEFCANHFSALYYSELWCQEMIEKIQREDSTYCEKRSTMIDNIYEKADQEFGETLHNILRNAYKSIGEFDALPGCGTSFLLQPKYRVEHYKEQAKFDQVIQFYANQPSSSKELIDSFKNYGLYQIPVMCSQLEEPEYECLWRLSHWSFGEKKVSLSDDAINYENFEKFRFSSLRALKNKNIGLFEESSNSQFICITNHLKNISLESSHSLYPVLTKLQSLIEMEDFSNSTNPEKLASLMEKWKLQDKLIRKNDFQYVEPIIAQRLVMLTNYLNSGPCSGDTVRDYIVDLSLSFAGWAKDEDYCKDGLMILENLKRIRSLSSDTNHKIDLLDAQLSWSLNNTVVARQILKRLCNNKLYLSPKLHALALKLTGQYMSETHSENRTTIITDYFLASVNIMGNLERNEDDIKSVMDTYDKLALFADKEYQQIKAYMKSDLFQKKIANMEQAKKAAASIQKQRIRTTDEKKAAAIHDRNSNIDIAEIRTTKRESNQFLKIALK